MKLSVHFKIQKSIMGTTKKPPLINRNNLQIRCPLRIQILHQIAAHNIISMN